MNFKALRHSLALAVLVTACSAAPALAHHFWVIPDATSSASVQAADIVYGHHFPTPEEIPAERTDLFPPLKLVTPKGEVELGQQDNYDNFHFSTNQKLDDGLYLLRGDYKPTFWANGDKGWQMTDMKGYDGKATYGEEAQMFAKSILQIGKGGDAALISKPLGTRLEIVPLAAPSSIKVGDRFPIQVLFDGKPLKTAEVKARYAGYSDNDEEEAYYGRTDIKGNAGVIISHAGTWAIEVRNMVPHADQARANEYVACATLTFKIDE